MDDDTKRVEQILGSVRDLAIQYYEITGKPLGVTAEIGEFEASQHLHLTLSGPRSLDTMPCGHQGRVQDGYR